MDLQLSELSALDREIHEPARLAIKADFLFLQRTTELTKGNLSSHLARLERPATWRSRRPRGKVPLTVCRLTKAGRAAFQRYRATLRKVLLK